MGHSEYLFALSLPIQLHVEEAVSSAFKWCKYRVESQWIHPSSLFLRRPTALCSKARARGGLLDARRMTYLPTLGKVCT